ncbi:L-glutamate gamma-semialdehyde dehydrogenase, partial [Paenibacillus sepulcri]|nr:L-glutamate gamma-semialdehyde dehydrogenase [Paenibacillus sepulcri]
MPKNELFAPFVNEPLTDFSQEENRRAITEAIAGVKLELGKEYPLHIGGKAILTAERTVSINPADTSQIIGSVSKASREQAEQAMQASLGAFES